ncbi:hypothetical protein GJAV_G00136690 [Gymnothorax javanicus]|nr:hypothetical protein GJAV_G00136690 [Gymnothorax javanicus]
MTMPMCGGLGAPQAATADIQKLCDQLKPEAEEKAEKKFNLFTAVSYKTQVVAGTNYFIKVLVGENECLHIRVFCPLPHANAPPSLSGQEEGKRPEDDISYF